MKKKVFTVCGSGVATSVVCAKKIKDYCDEQGIDVDVSPISFGQLSGNNIEADLIVSVNSRLKLNNNIPIISGISLLTGIGQKSTLEQIVDVLKNH
ncbi:MAG: PTS galactitol transporter subunit IIB [Clostridium sp.]|uniref:PTS sugar transporter subunit IIB n=1 Tax=Clostridium sp. TaxID=1506 RepID=UPI0025BD4B50|nr:PTS galactitol transporter subunit IIB [Clostridium sp.]MCH3965101.1 PTS galactitol transporter subunit IIB [Clostridium sp.]MCI1714322.1 PTS galactitol transporter subunit IIB [Clostridium sp.]MCI1798584.1 PTS galactitol transporter subunit IIB [Clostridium sp.]MCI1812685.1 PTS galactitol transporter subunit IIB [Clostridium sp.]MCI1869393.1 PTS galactitol transporter subunit IIB [Clostridium sp.]